VEGQTDYGQEADYELDLSYPDTSIASPSSPKRKFSIASPSSIKTKRFSPRGKVDLRHNLVQQEDGGVVMGDASKLHIQEDTYIEDNYEDDITAMDKYKHEDYNNDQYE